MSLTAASLPTAQHPRVAVRGGYTREEWSVGAKLTLVLWDGPVLELTLDLLPLWCRLRLRLWYSPAMERRAWDRWQAASLAGEHRGITLTVTEAPSAPSSVPPSAA